MSDILAKKTQRNNSNIKMPFCHPPSKKESRCIVAGKFNVNVAKPCVV